MTIRELYSKTKSTLRNAAIEFPDFEADQLLKSVGIEKTTLITEPGREVGENISREISSLVERRLRGEPLQYLVGEWEFYGLPFKVGEGVLIPRQDTETLVELALDFLKGRDIKARRTVDLCSGTGCIGITLAKLTGANVLCVEMYYAAEQYLRQNIKLNGVEVSVSMEDACSEDI
ncbi:MAG: peptide chain release factor N(5)-glutamine methyltransferase, partial [Oscillospiraceae bacterium]|nr:peptide chain release factor N(5)-glutamine methyltransferase [Oscillospiraceae bacterium]